MCEITLTEEQVMSIQNDMGGIEMLNDEEINALAQKVNKVINLPFIGEEKEFIVFVKIIKWIDRKLYELLPNEYYSLVRDSNDGITKDEAKLILKRLTPLINNAINIPVLNEKQESILIELILELIINAMIKGFKLEQVEIKEE